MILDLVPNINFCWLFAVLINVFVQLNVEFPFEFRALEVALEGICVFLDERTRELETAAYPALDELTSKVRVCLTKVCLFINSYCWIYTMFPKFPFMFLAKRSLPFQSRQCRNIINLVCIYILLIKHHNKFVRVSLILVLHL